jgi:hypothetical protein
MTGLLITPDIAGLVKMIFPFLEIEAPGVLETPGALTVIIPYPALA